MNIFTFRNKKITAQEQQFAALHEKIQLGITALKSSELGDSDDAALYTLPWYLIVGASSSGKTTLLRNSELHFPYSSCTTQDSTIDCEWWFAESAVLIDTAGRYFTETESCAEWYELLSQLKKFRNKLPLNGIVLTINLKELFSASDEKLGQLAKHIREYIEEIYHNLAYLLPVYVVITQMDSLPGFSEFFADLNEEQRTQVWGISFADRGEQQTFAMQSLQMYEKLLALSVDKISRSRNYSAKFASYDFTQQFSQALKRLQYFFAILFKDNPFQETPEFYGVYLTSGAQGYFVKELFQKIIFQEKNIKQHQKRFICIRESTPAKFICAASIVLAVVLLCSAALHKNSTLLQRGSDLANQLFSELHDPQLTNNKLMNLLSQAFVHYQTLLAYQQHTPWYLRLGLYRGDVELKPFEHILRETMQRAFLQPDRAANLFAWIQYKGVTQLGIFSFAKGGALFKSNYPLANIYTAKGWKEFVAPEIALVAHLAAENDAEKIEEKLLSQQLRHLYFSEYQNHWQQFLTSIHMKPFNSLDEASKQLLTLANPQGAYKKLLQEVVENGVLTNIPELEKFSQYLQFLINPKVEMYFKQLALVQAEIDHLATGADVVQDTQNFATQLLTGQNNPSELFKSSLMIKTLLHEIENAETREALNQSLSVPIREVWRAILHEVSRGLDQRWRANVITLYAQTIQNKFPFSKTGSDVSLTEFNHFFQPKEGVLWSFVTNHLAPFLSHDQNGFHTHEWLGVGIDFSADFLAALTQAKRLSENLFPSDTNSAAMNFEIYPAPTPGLNEIRLQTNQQQLRYQNGPQEWYPFSWPGSANSSTETETSLTIFATKSFEQTNQEYSGPWGLFHLFSHAKISLVSEENYQVTWTMKIKGRHYLVNFLLRPRSVLDEMLVNPLRLPSSIVA